MESNQVLQYFVDLCNNQSGFLQQSIADNAVLEWFGRTIRGSTRIRNYLRYDLCPQYEHIFTVCESSPPIETRKMHMKTMKIPKNCIQTKFESSNDHNEFETPSEKITSPTLPELRRGSLFLPTKDEFNDLQYTEIQEAVTPPPNIKNISNEFSEPSHKKLKIDESLPDVNDKQIKHFDEDILVYHDMDKSHTTSNKKNAYNNESNDDVVADKIIESSVTDMHYSNLMYFETIGVLKLKSKSKHRGITNFPHETDNSKQANLVNCGNNTPTNNFGWERKTKIKFSYRIRKEDNHIQFALIIYEHLERNSLTTRRNLLEEFQETDNDKKETKSQKVKRKTPLKRALRLF